jgi:hypothetical protein
MKFLLNGLHGRFGLKNNQSVSKIVTQDEADKLDLVYNLIEKSLVSEVNYKYYVRYKSRNPDFLLNNVEKTFEGSNKRSRRMPSSVQISAATNAYARISMYKYKNIPDNRLIYSDTP